MTYGNEDTLVSFTHPATGEEIKTFQPYKAIANLGDIHFNIIKYENRSDVLTTPYVFIGDTDIDDDGTWGFNNFFEIKKKFPEYAFRLYRTYKGYRFFIVNSTVRILSDSLKVNSLFKSFDCDKNYCNQVFYNIKFAARLTKKDSTKRESPEAVVCALLHSDISLEEMPWNIRKLIEIHDFYTL
jgi:hypothetical protein